MNVAILSRRELSVSLLSAELGIPVIEGEVTNRAGTVVQVRIDQFDQYRSLMSAGSLAIVDLAAEAVMVRLGESETWLLANASNSSADTAAPADDGEGCDLLALPEYTLDTDRANRVASRIAQAPGFAVVAKKPSFRDEFARSYVTDWYDADATDWHVREIAGRARNLWEFGVLPRDAKAMHGSGESLPAIATALGVSKNRAKWALDLPEAHAMTDYL